MAVNSLPDNQVYRAVLEAIESWNPVSGDSQWSDETFGRLARRVFQFQFEQNEAYRDFCERRGIDPGGVESYREIPAVATDVFKHVDLGVSEEAVRVFRTSGTTAEVRGRHGFETLELYRASIHPPFVRFCNPRQSSFRMLVCAPPPSELPDSSLSFMLGELVETWGDGEGEFFAGGGPESGPSGMAFDFQGFCDALDRAEREGVETFVLGTAYGFAEFFDRVDDVWELADGSRIVETGGFKGRTDDVTKDELYDSFERRLGMDVDHCIAEYSMTELSSQAYTPNLVGGDEASPSARGFVAPPWARIEVVDPATLEVREEPGRRGLIRWYDLANVGSVCAVQTSDLGEIDTEGRVRHLGRAEAAPLRGCSLTAEEIAGDFGG